MLGIIPHRPRITVSVPIKGPVDAVYRLLFKDRNISDFVLASLTAVYTQQSS